MHSRRDSLVCAVECDGVTCEVDDILAQIKLLVNLTHCGLLGIHTLHSFGVVLIKVGYENQELTKPSLLKQPHQT